MEEIRNEKETVLLVGLNTGETKNFDFAMEELGNLARACDMEPSGMITQNMEKENKSYLIGEGKLEEIKRYLTTYDIDSVVFNNTLSPAQLSNLQHAIDVPVYDRTGLILQIFDRRARSREARLQVEIARLQYILPRLSGLRTGLSRQGGAGGSMSSKGAGETKLELDRRKLEHRLTMLNRELKAVSEEKSERRKKRSISGIYRVALVGYTNAGKSTILNTMQSLYGVYASSGAGESKEVLAKDMLFATLDTTVRRIRKPETPTFLLADTVGFISELPHHLVKAFRSTLDEALEADLIIQVIDISDPDYELHAEVTNETLKELNAGDIPRLFVYNKADVFMNDRALPGLEGNRILMSAKEPKHMEFLHGQIIERMRKSHVEKTYLFPYERSDLAAYLNEVGACMHTEYGEEGILVKALVGEADCGRLKTYEKINSGFTACSH